MSKNKQESWITLEAHVDAVRHAYVKGMEDRPQRFDALTFFTVVFAFSWLVFMAFALGVMLK